jgi:hypothetical protein
MIVDSYFANGGNFIQYMEKTNKETRHAKLPQKSQKAVFP